MTPCPISAQRSDRRISFGRSHHETSNKGVLVKIVRNALVDTDVRDADSLAFQHRPTADAGTHRKFLALPQWTDGIFLEVMTVVPIAQDQSNSIGSDRPPSVVPQYVPDLFNGLSFVQKPGCVPQRFRCFGKALNGHTHIPRDGDPVFPLSREDDVKALALQLVANGGNQSSRFQVLGAGAPWGAIERAGMQDAEIYERYAKECERIARTMSGEQHSSLLAIARAWRELAREAERQSDSRGT
jgi:hypothetical protein